MKKTKKLNFFKWNKEVVLTTFRKIDLNIILIVFIDVLFYMLVDYLINVWSTRIEARMASFNLAVDLKEIGQAQAEKLLSEFQAFSNLIIFSFILLVVAIIFLASIAKGIIWAKTTRTKITFNLLSKFLALNIVWMGFWIAVFFLIQYLALPEAVNTFKVVTLMIAIYFTNTVYSIFMKDQSVSSVINAIKLNFSKFHLFLLPYIIIFFVFFVLLIASSSLRFKYSGFTFFLIAVIWSAVARYYAFTIVSEAEKA